MFANGRLPMAAAARGANTTFYLAKVPPTNAGRSLSIQFFDVGDANVAGTLTILRPADATGSAWSCTLQPPPGRQRQPPTRPASTGLRPHERAVDERLPGLAHDGPGGGALGNYSCSPATATGCWVRILFSYPPTDAVLDHTVWEAGVAGDPVRLIE